MSRPNNDQAATKEAKPSKTSFLDKEVITTMEDFMRFVAWSKRPGSDKKPCVVDEELFDIISEGDLTSPLFWKDNCPIVDASRKQEAIDMLTSKKNTALVIL